MMALRQSPPAQIVEHRRRISTSPIFSSATPTGPM
jgi:hypothetical protein